MYRSRLGCSTRFVFDVELADVQFGVMPSCWSRVLGLTDQIQCVPAILIHPVELYWSEPETRMEGFVGISLNKVFGSIVDLVLLCRLMLPSCPCQRGADGSGGHGRSWGRAGWRREAWFLKIWRGRRSCSSSGAWAEDDGGSCDCSPSTMKGGGAQFREVRGASPAVVVHRFSSRRPCARRVSLEVLQLMLSWSLGVGIVVFAALVLLFLRSLLCSFPDRWGVCRRVPVVMLVFNL